MALVLDATVGGVNANSYATLAEAQAYFDSRLSLTGWDDADSQEVLLVMGTRVLNAMAQPNRTLIPAQTGIPAYYRIHRQWTGSPATTTQRLAWPRIGMFDKNGNAIASNVIPQDLKDALAELAGQLGLTDRTLDNDVVVRGLTFIGVGPTQLKFKSDIVPQVIPDAVFNLLPQSWLTDELYEPAIRAQFDVVSAGSNGGIVL